MLFSIIIPTCNRNDLLGKCLHLLSPKSQTIDASQYEVIVTDDSKENIARGLVERNYPWVKWVEGPKKGPAANRNNGARYAKGTWFVFLDDDCLPSTDLLEVYNQSILKYKNFSVFEGSISSNTQRKRMNEEAPLNEGGGYLWSCNFMIKKKIFELLKGFNESFIYAAMEDVEFRDRVKIITSIKFIPEAKVIHPWRIVDKPLLRWNMALESHKIYLNVYPKGLKKFSFFPFIKQILYSFIFQTIPAFIKYKGKGLSYSFYYHIFQIRLLFYCLLFSFKKRNI